MSNVEIYCVHCPHAWFDLDVEVCPKCGSTETIRHFDRDDVEEPDYTEEEESDDD